MTNLPIDSPWRPKLDWDTPAGKVLCALVDELGNAEGDWLVSALGRGYSPIDARKGWN